MAAERGVPTLPLLFDAAKRPERPDTTAIRVIRFLTDDDYPPFHFIGPDGQLTGFNVDLARALCLELKVACTLQARRWDTLVDALEQNRGDAIIASLAMTEASRARLDFTVPYYRTPARFLVATTAGFAAAEPGAATLSGRRVGVVRGSAHAAFLASFFTAAVPVPQDDLPAAMAALRRGEVETVFGDAVGMAIWLNGENAAGCCRFWGGPFLESAYFGEGVGIAVQRGNTSLRRALDYALHRVAEKGIYADLYLKYFPVGFY